MSKAQYTKANIIEKASVLFNSKGYANTSLSDITTVTGLTKGAIYRHFENKEALELESFAYLSQTVISTLNYKVKEQSTASEKLQVIFAFFEKYLTNIIVTGGCPLLNVAIEVDETNSKLKAKALEMLTVLRFSVQRILNNGIRHKQLKNDTPVDTLTTIIITSLEGAIMTSKLSGNKQDLKIVTLFLSKTIQSYKN
jgi:TetR/AcrR family transcriptional regulator, transcriptional repressor for nem operon